MRRLRCLTTIPGFDLVWATVIVVLAARSDLRAHEEEAEKLHAFIGQGLQARSLTGFAVAVVKEDKLVFLRGHGVRDVRMSAPHGRGCHD